MIFKTALRELDQFTTTDACWKCAEINTHEVVQKQIPLIGPEDSESAS